MTGGAGVGVKCYFKTGNELCRNERYSRRIGSFLHNPPPDKTKSCTQALYQNLRAELALHGNFDTIAVRVHFGASGCKRVQFVLVLALVNK